MYIVINKETGKMVADQNKRQGSSYTDNIIYAKIYSSQETAQNDCCGNEYPQNIECLLRRLRAY